VIEMILIARLPSTRAAARGEADRRRLLLGAAQALVGIYGRVFEASGRKASRPRAFIARMARSSSPTCSAIHRPQPAYRDWPALACGEALKACHLADGRWQMASITFYASLVSFVVLLLAAALYLSFSRGAWLGAAAALLAMGLFLPRRRWIGLAVIGGLIAIGLGLYSANLLPASIADRFADVGALIDFRDVRG
jgi:hypothetical protein